MQGEQFFELSILVYNLGCRSRISVTYFFRFGFVPSRSMLSRFFDLNGFTLVVSKQARVYILGSVVLTNALFKKPKNPTVIKIVHYFTSQLVVWEKSYWKRWMFFMKKLIPNVTQIKMSVRIWPKCQILFGISLWSTFMNHDPIWSTSVFGSKTPISSYLG